MRAAVFELMLVALVGGYILLPWLVSPTASIWGY